MNMRTDLALESIDAEKISNGIYRSSRGEAFRITEIQISDDSCGKKIGKRKGKYITLEGSPLGRFSEEFRKMASELSNELASGRSGARSGTGQQRHNPRCIRPYVCIRNTCHTPPQ